MADKLNETMTCECDEKEEQQTKKVPKSRDPNYYKEYYQNHKDTMGVYTVKKYAKNKYRLTDDECARFKDDVCKYGQYKKLKCYLQEKFPDEEF